MHKNHLVQALDDTFATEAEVNSATSSLSSSLAVDIASNLSEITNLNSFSESIESHLPSGTISGSSQITDGSGRYSKWFAQLEGYVSSSTANVIEVMTSASYQSNHTSKWNSLYNTRLINHEVKRCTKHFS